MDARPSEVDEIIIVVGYKADMIKRHLGNSYKGRSIRYVHQWMPAGTAHALSMVELLRNERFIFMNGDDPRHGRVYRSARIPAHSRRDTTILKVGVIELGEDGTLASNRSPKSADESQSTGAMVLISASSTTKRCGTKAVSTMTYPLACAQDHPSVITRISAPINVQKISRRQNRR
jgi:hypothetical protein